VGAGLRSGVGEGAPLPCGPSQIPCKRQAPPYPGDAAAGALLRLPRCQPALERNLIGYRRVILKGIIQGLERPVIDQA